MPQRGRAASRRRLRGGIRHRRRRRAQGRAGADPAPRSRSRKATMTIDLSGCSAERKSGVNSRTLAGARVAYKALTGPHDPVNEGSFRALNVIIPEGNVMMARYPGADVVVEHHDPDGGRHHRQGAGAADARPRAGRASRPPRRRGRVLRRASEDQAPLRGAEHRGRRLGRPSLRGRRVRHRLGLPGRRAQRLDRGHRAEMPGAGGRPRAAHGLRRRRQASRRARHRHAGAATWSRAAGISSRRAAASARPGACGAAATASRAPICCGSPARTTSR